MSVAMVESDIVTVDHYLRENDTSVKKIFSGLAAGIEFILFF